MTGSPPRQGFRVVSPLLPIPCRCSRAASTAGGPGRPGACGVGRRRAVTALPKGPRAAGPQPGRRTPTPSRPCPRPMRTFSPAASSDTPQRFFAIRTLKSVPSEKSESVCSLPQLLAANLPIPADREGGFLKGFRSARRAVLGLYNGHAHNHLGRAISTEPSR